MTLSTHVRIVEPTQVRPIFDECRRILGAEHARYFEKDGTDRWSRGNRGFYNEIGQGFPALMHVEYGADGPLREYEDLVNDPALVDEDHVYRPQASIEVMFDTTYGYRADNGAGCADLHAWLIVELGRWLNERGLTWWWQNEFSGEWFHGLDAEGLAAFGDPIKGEPFQACPT